jgi:SAM-dependent methyltransferase
MARSNPGEFFDRWSVYDQVLDHNYMFHDEMFNDVRLLFIDRFGKRSFTVLDLGCGSARHLSRALQGCSVSRYVGYDLSDAALAQAKGNLAGLRCPVELHQGDLLEGLKDSERFDLIFSSFALHHLVSGDKANFFQFAYQRLDEKGILVLIDVMRENDEDRPVYLDRYCGWLRSEWKTLTTEALDAFCDHIRSYDFPETAAAIRAMAKHAGFSCSEVNRYRWHHIWQFDKSHSRVESASEKVR